jgi:hypothetical protein
MANFDKKTSVLSRQSKSFILKTPFKNKNNINFLFKLFYKPIYPFVQK